MARICCGVVGESEPAAPVEPSSRTSRRRRLELQPFKLVADAAAQLPKPLENGQKRQRLELFTALSTRENSEANELERSRSDNNEQVHKNEALNLISRVNLEDNAENESPKYGMTSVCGRRRDMEDAVSIHTSFYHKKNSVSAKTHFFGVFDGHGCSHVAFKCKDRLHEIVKEELEAYKEEETVEWKKAMERSYERMDQEVQMLTEKSKTSSCRCELQTPQCEAVGSTAVVAIVTPNKIIVSNCGDSRAVLCRNGVAVPLSSDHKPDRPDELLRIQEAGGRVIYWEAPRVLGVLAMSRAIGDNYLKPYVIPQPEVTVTECTAEDECLILASDGLWDAVSNDTAVKVVRTCFRAHRTSSPGSEAAGGRSFDKACSDASVLLTKLALARHSMDNVSVVVVDLRKNSQQETRSHSLQKLNY